jgi:hypothetical protein
MMTLARFILCDKPSPMGFMLAVAQKTVFTWQRYLLTVSMSLNIYRSRYIPNPAWVSCFEPVHKLVP